MTTRTRNEWGERIFGNLAALQPALEHQLHGERRHRPIGERAGAALPGPKQRRGLGRVLKPSPLEVGRDPFVEIMAHRDLPDLALLFPQTAATGGCRCPAGPGSGAG